MISGVARPRSIARLAYIEHRLFSRPLLQLLLPDAAGEEALWPDEHDNYEDEPENDVVQALDLVVQADPAGAGLVQEAKADEVAEGDGIVRQVGQNEELHDVDR